MTELSGQSEINHICTLCQHSHPHENESTGWIPTEEDKSEILQRLIEEKHKDWPWEGDGLPSKLVLQAPYAVNITNLQNEESGFRLPEIKQTCRLLTVHGGVLNPILEILFTYHGVASKFGATCQKGFHLVSAYMDHWDITRHRFNNCEHSAHNKKAEFATVGKVVVVTPFRSTEVHPGNLAHEMLGIQKLTRAFERFSDRFEILHLHRIPFLTPQVLSLVVPCMRRLRVLGVYRCELIHLGHTMELLKIIRTDRGAGMTTNIRLDFYPRYHLGPKTVEEGYVSSYGITWDNFKLDIRLAAWKIISDAVRQAERQGVDLYSHSSAFYLWMTKTPLWRIEETVYAILHESDPQKFVSQVDYPHTKGHTSRLGHGNECREYDCICCKQRVLGIFFDWIEYYEAINVWGGALGMVCLGCKLTARLNDEKDHWKFLKNMLMKHWLKDNADDLQKALSKDSLNRACHGVALKLPAIAKHIKFVLQKQNVLWMQEDVSSLPRSKISADVFDKEPKDPQW